MKRLIDFKLTLDIKNQDFTYAASSRSRSRFSRSHIIQQFELFHQQSKQDIQELKQKQEEQLQELEILLGSQ